MMEEVIAKKIFMCQLTTAVHILEECEKGYLPMGHRKKEGKHQHHVPCICQARTS